MKRIFALILTLALISSMALSASAATTGNWNSGTNVSHTIVLDYNGGYRYVREGYSMKKLTSETISGIGNITLPEITPSRMGMKFAGWEASSGKIYEPGDTVVMYGTKLTLTAVWESYWSVGR